MSAEPHLPDAADAHDAAGAAGERWRDAVAQLEYAERHGAAALELERLADRVIEARVAMFQAGVRDGWRLPEFLQASLERDRHLIEGWPVGQEDFYLALPDANLLPDAGALPDADAVT